MSDAAQNRDSETDVRQRLARHFAGWASSDAPGLTVGIRYRGDVIFRDAFGMASLESARALTPGSRIRIGSTAKHMTALLALLMAEDGLLSLDEPIRSYLPELAGPEGDATIRQHCQHRGGGRCYFDLSSIAHLDAVSPSGRALELAIRQQHRNFEPGTAMIYCNSGYHLVSLALERVSGSAFEELLTSRLFVPLGMHDTVSVRSDNEILPGVATLHVPCSNQGWRRGLFPTEEVLGEGAVISTIDDMLIWTAHLRSRDRFGSEKSWQELFERPNFPDGWQGNYALGLIHGEHRGRPIYFHAGGVIGGLSQMLVFPEHELDIIILANGARDADPVALAFEAADIVLGEEQEKSETRTPPDELSGVWISHETGMVYNIDVDERGARLGVAGGPAGSPLTQGSNGCWIAGAVTISRLEIDPARLSEGLISIRFGGSEATYHKRQESRPDLLPSRILRAGDAEADARFERGEERDLLHISDPIGTNTMALDWLDHRAALATSVKEGLPFTAAILLDAAGDAFNLNTARTRWLRFN